MDDTIPKYEVLIVGGGVVGTALLYILSKYADIQKYMAIHNHILS